MVATVLVILLSFQIYNLGSLNCIIFMPGLPNGAIPQEGVLFSERRSGKRGKRHKGLNKPNDRKSPPLASEKEENGSVQPKHELNSNGDGGMLFFLTTNSILSLLILLNETTRKL